MIALPITPLPGATVLSPRSVRRDDHAPPGPRLRPDLQLEDPDAPPVPQPGPQCNERHVRPPGRYRAPMLLQIGEGHALGQRVR
eukprot:2884830-Rhodomonas_salina.3